MIRAIVLAVVVFLFLAGCLFGGAGTVSWPMAWAVLGIYAASKVGAFILVDPDLIRERAAPGPNVDRIDRIVAAVGYLGLYPATFLVAGLDAMRLGPALTFSLAIQAIAFIIYTLGYSFATWAIYCNPFFSTFVRIQDDRHHSVVSSGPYALVRHPGYAGVLLAHLALPFAFNAIWALIPVVTGIVLFVVRTAREDQTLQDHLAGYQEYQKRVRWRLLPGVW